MARRLVPVAVVAVVGLALVLPFRDRLGDSDDPEPVDCSSSAIGRPAPTPTTSPRQDWPGTGASFGPKTAWLAVAGVDPATVGDGLGLHGVEPVDALDGINQAYESGVVLLGPVDGWTLAMGVDLAMEDDP